MYWHGSDIRSVVALGNAVPGSIALGRSDDVQRIHKSDGFTVIKRKRGRVSRREKERDVRVRKSE